VPLVVVQPEPGAKVQLVEGVIAPAPWNVSVWVGERFHTDVQVHVPAGMVMMSPSTALACSVA